MRASGGWIGLGLQGGYTKHLCFLCFSDSQADDHRYIRQQLPPRQGLEPGYLNGLSLPLVEANKMVLPHLHIKLKLIKNVVNTMDIEGGGYTFP